VLKEPGERWLGERVSEVLKWGVATLVMKRRMKQTETPFGKTSNGGLQGKRRGREKERIKKKTRKRKGGRLFL